MTRLWLAREDVLRITGWSEGTLRAKVRDGVVQSRLIDRRESNSRRVREYDFNSLPSEAQCRYIQSQSAISAQSLPAPDPLQPTLFETSRLPAVVPPEKQGRAEELLESIALMIDWSQGKRDRRFRNMDEVAAYCAQRAGLSKRAIWDRYSKCKTEGVARLVKPRVDAGTQKFFKTYPDAEKFLRAKFTEGWGPSAACDALKREWENIYNHGSEPCSLSTVRTLFQRMPPVQRDAVRLPRQQWESKHAAYLITDQSKIQPNQVWVADHRIFDDFCCNDFFGKQPDLRAMRVWETVIEDMRTRAIVGWCFCATPSSRSIASALRMAIQRFGRPQEFYCDNGKDFRKVGRGAVRESQLATDEELELDDQGRVAIDAERWSLLARLGITVRYCIPHHPQSKQIESFFNYQSRRFDAMFGQAYAGRRPQLRSDANADALKLHKNFLDSKTNAQQLQFPLASDFMQLAAAWFEEFNCTHEHSGRGMDKRTPYEVFNALMPEEKREHVNVEQIAHLFWDQQKRKVQNCAVEIYGARFEAADEPTGKRMHFANGTEILVHCDPMDLGHAVAFDITGQQYIGALRAQKLLQRGPTSHDDIKRVSRARRQLYRTTRQLNELAASGVPTELEFMRNRTNVIEAPMPARPALRELPIAANSRSLRPRYVDDVVADIRALMNEEEG